MQAHALGIDSALGRSPFHRQSYDKRESGDFDGTAFVQTSRRSSPLHIFADGFYKWRREVSARSRCGFTGSRLD